MRRYTLLLIPDHAEGGYTARVPALPGCITEGDTLEEVLQNAREAIRLYLADLEASGEPIPEETAPYELIRVDVA
ncbi:MAG: type II toxin-antitoxin system HicB family antitoxin [Chloroflexi bacterium]|nr:type II toxin-antitoxin system HicB family antitoxin [Chloroflexota bacterium]